MRKYYQHTIKNTAVVHKIITIDFFQWKNNYSTESELHDFWEFTYCKSGNITYRLSDKNVKISAGEILFLEPKIQHSINEDEKSPAELFILCFKTSSPILDTLSGYQKSITKLDHSLITNIMEEAINTFDLSIFSKLTPLSNPRLGGEQYIKCLLEILLINILREQSEGPSPYLFFKQEDNEKQVCEQVLSFLKQNTDKKLSIDNICDKVHYSRSYISHLFKKNYGKSIIDCFNELKIKKAKELLLNNQLTIAKISDMLDFTDLHYFNYLFKKYTKMTPSEYRASLFKQVNFKKLESENRD